MRSIYALIALGVAFTSTVAAGAPTEVDRLLAGYRSVQTVSCEVRRTRKSDELTLRFLSRVHYQRPNRIHVENIAPDERRIIADGTQVYEYRRDEAEGRVESIEQMPETRLFRLRAVPGSPMDHLLRLEGAPEQDLGPSDEYPVRKTYTTDTRFVELDLDDQGRLARIAIYTDPSRKQQIAEYHYESFLRVSDSVWLARVHRGTVQSGGSRISDTSRFTNVAVNEAIAPSLFDVAAVLPGVSFRNRSTAAPGGTSE